MQEQQTVSKRSSSELDSIINEGLSKMQQTDDIDTASKIIAETGPAIEESQKKLEAAVSLAAETFDASNNVKLLQQMIKTVLDNQKTKDSLPANIIESLLAVANYDPSPK